MERTLVTMAVNQLKDAGCYLEKTCDTAYNQPLPRLSGNTIGHFTRLVISHYQALSKAMRASMTEERAVLNYDLNRCYSAIGQSPRVALAAVEDLCEKMPRYVNNGPVWLEDASFSVDKPMLFPTTIERELLVNLERTNHLFELVKIGLNIVSPCLELPAHFGKMQIPIMPVGEPVPMYPTFSLAEPEQFRIAV